MMKFTLLLFLFALFTQHAVCASSHSHQQEEHQHEDVEKLPEKRRTSTVEKDSSAKVRLLPSPSRQLDGVYELHITSYTAFTNFLSFFISTYEYQTILYLVLFTSHCEKTWEYFDDNNTTPRGDLSFRTDAKLGKPEKLSPMISKVGTTHIFDCLFHLF